jgi:hypothetical protein
MDKRQAFGFGIMFLICAVIGIALGVGAFWLLN